MGELHAESTLMKYILQGAEGGFYFGAGAGSRAMIYDTLLDNGMDSLGVEDGAGGTIVTNFRDLFRTFVPR